MVDHPSFNGSSGSWHPDSFADAPPTCQYQ
jgi:hypothetical protein